MQFVEIEIEGKSYNKLFVFGWQSAINQHIVFDDDARRTLLTTDEFNSQYRITIHNAGTFKIFLK